MSMGSILLHNEYKPTFYYTERNTLQSFSLTSQEWSSVLEDQDFNKINISPRQYLFNYTNDTAKLKELKIKFSSPNSFLQMNMKNWGAKLLFDSWPGMTLSYRNNFVKMEIGEKQIWDLRINTHTFLDEYQEITYSPVDWFAKFTTKFHNFSMENHYQAPLFIRSSWDFRRMQWSLYNRLRYDSKKLSLQLEGFLGEFNLQGKFQQKTWLNIDTLQWAGIHSFIQLNSENGHFIKGGLFWARAEVGDNTFLEPLPISPLSIIEMTKWRIQGLNFATKASYLDLGSHWNLHKYIFNLNLLSIYPFSFDFNTNLKSRYITIYPFFSYKQNQLHWGSPWDILLQPRISIHYPIGTTQFKFQASQWIPISWKSTPDKDVNKTSLPANNPTTNPTENFNPASTFSTQSKSRWGGLCVSFQFQWQLFP